MKYPKHISSIAGAYAHTGKVNWDNGARCPGHNHNKMRTMRRIKRIIRKQGRDEINTQLDD